MMPSSFMVKRNYAHCPLKKRPFALFNEPASAPEQEQPEDLSLKRPRLEAPTPPASESKLCLPPTVPSRLSLPLSATVAPTVSVSHSALSMTIKEEPSRSSPVFTVYPEYQSASSQVKPIVPLPVHSTPVPQRFYYTAPYGVSPPPPPPHMAEPPSRVETSYLLQQQPKPSSENLPTLAEYYLQLFRSTSEAEAQAKRSEHPSGTHHNWHETSAYTLPPSPQASPVTPNSYSSQASYETVAPSSIPAPHHYYSSPMPSYPDSSALISPVSTCSSISDSEEEIDVTLPLQKNDRKSARHSCNSCGKSYSTQSGLRKHNELHCASLGARVFSCKHCAKTYTSVGALKMHIRTHTLPCKCHVCGKAFSRPWLLQGHIRTHTGEKPFECQQCHRSFADRSNLRAHQQTHERVKKYACQICLKTFSRMSLLNKHSENVCVGGGQSCTSGSPTSSPSSSPEPSPMAVHHHLN